MTSGINMDLIFAGINKLSPLEVRLLGYAIRETSELFIVQDHVSAIKSYESGGSIRLRTASLGKSHLSYKNDFNRIVGLAAESPKVFEYFQARQDLFQKQMAFVSEASRETPLAKAARDLSPEARKIINELLIPFNETVAAARAR